MNARIFASILAAAAMFGSLPLWWWLHHQQAVPTDASVADGDTVAPDGGAAGAPAPVEPTDAASEAAEAQPASPMPQDDPPARPDQTQPELIPGPDPGRSPLADRLNAEDGTIGADLAIVQGLLENYILEFGAKPVGSNREITAQLSGRNAQKHTPLPKDVGAIAEDGQLVDRWGTPFFFHALSAGAMEVRSAGPDREFYTGDDAILPPASR